jgi:hypothetical protein
MKALGLLLILAGLSSPLSSQQTVLVTGRIDKLVGAPPTCAPTATHELRDSGVYLMSSTMDLDTVLSSNRQIAAFDISGSCPLLDVGSVASSSFTLGVCNATALGCTFTLDLCPSPSTGVYVMFGSTANGFLPIDLTIGTALIDPTSFFLLAAGAETAVCQSLPVTITGSPSMVGLDLFVQALDVPPVGSPLLSNVAKVTVLSPSIPCTSFACY